MLIWKSFIFALTALLPILNPIGTALVFLDLVGDESPAVYRQLAGRVAVASFGFLILIEFLGSLLLKFFGISLPVVQVTGGLIIAATAWSLLFEKDAGAVARGKHQEIGGKRPAEDDDLFGKVFYPFTFPITAGPGALVVMLTLSARASANAFPGKAAAHAGTALAAAVLSGLVYLSYGYAPRLIQAVSPSRVHGIMRVVSFLLMCIGVQLVWNGLHLLGTGLLTHQ